MSGAGSAWLEYYLDCSDAVRTLDEWRSIDDERQLWGGHLVWHLLRVASARPGVRQALALPVHPAIAFGACFLRGALLSGGLARAFFLHGSAGRGRFAVLGGFGQCDFGARHQA